MEMDIFHVDMSGRIYEKRNIGIALVGMETKLHCGCALNGNLIKLVKKLELDKKVHFVGALTEAELAKAYANAAVYCYPSPEEDFGLGPLEAGGWGVPTVAWNHAGPTVTVVDGVTGFLAKPYEVKDYCEKITKILCDRKLREKMGEASRERTKNEFSWERHVGGIEEVINELLEK